jgi:hypothetical protein
VKVKKPKLPHGYWTVRENHRLFLDNFAKNHDIRNQSDWYNITNIQILQNGGSGLLLQYKQSLLNALKSIYPEYEWKKSHYTGYSTEGKAFRSKAQYQLYSIVKKLFSSFGIQIVCSLVPLIKQEIQSYIKLGNIVPQEVQRTQLGYDVSC